MFVSTVCIHYIFHLLDDKKRMVHPYDLSIHAPVDDDVPDAPADALPVIGSDPGVEELLGKSVVFLGSLLVRIVRLVVVLNVMRL